MLKIKEAVLVEGRYDKNALSQVVDTLIIESSGFGIFNNSEKMALLRLIAEKRGLIVLTDSDGAGFVIRNHIKSCIPPELIKHAYIPDIYGKEPRKDRPSKEGKLGVEGMRPQVLLHALRQAGATFDDSTPRPGGTITKADMYARGLSGKAGSREKRAELLKRLSLPGQLTADGLLQVLNVIMDREEFYELQL